MKCTESLLLGVVGRCEDGMIHVNPESSTESSVFIWTGKVKGKELYQSFRGFH